jgi:hypothetical protein
MCKSTKNGALGAFLVERPTFPLMAGLVLHGKGAYLELEVGTLTRYRLNPRPPLIVRWPKCWRIFVCGYILGNWGWYIILGELEGRMVLLFWENWRIRWRGYGHPLPAIRKPQPSPGAYKK